MNVVMNWGALSRTSPSNWLLAFFLFLTFSSAQSQVIQTPASEEQRRRAQVEAEERQRLLQEPNVELFPKEEEGQLDIAALPTEQSCFSLKQITLQVSPQLANQVKLQGASALPQDPFYFAQTYLNQYAGMCIGKNGLHILLQRLGNVLMHEGYSTTRVGLSDQDLSQGTLTLTLVPGIIRSILFSDDSLYGTWRNAFPTREGRVLNLRDLEQGLEQMKRVSNQDIDMQLAPSEASGETDIVLTVKRSKAWKVSAYIDNSGAKGTGKLQVGGNLSIDNLLGLSDTINIGVNTDADHQPNQRGTNGQNLYYTLPFGYWNYTLTASNSDYYQQIAGMNQDFLSSGKSRNLDNKLTYLFQRNQQQKNSLQFNVGKRWSHGYIDNTEVDVQKRDVTYLELGWVHKHYFGHAQLDFTLANRWGSSLFGGQRDAIDKMADYPTFQYSMQTIDATFTIPFHVANELFYYTGTLRGQTSRSPLYLSDQFSIGGRYTVRGFDGELTLAAERGFYLRNELTIPISTTSHSAYLGLDVGKVAGPSVEYLIGDTLAGATIGLRGAYKAINYDIFSSWPLHKPEHFTTSTPTVGFSLSVAY